MRREAEKLRLDVEVDAAFVHVDDDAVPVGDQGDRTTVRGLRGR